jgi:integrase
MTLAEALVKYRAVIQPHKAPSTQRDQASALKYWQRVLGHKVISEITPKDLAEQRDILLSWMKPGSVLHKLRVLSAVLTAAVKEFELIDTNPMLKVKTPPQPQRRVWYLSDDERSRLLEACQLSQNEHLYGLVLCAISTGGRVPPACG